MTRMMTFDAGINAFHDDQTDETVRFRVRYRTDHIDILGGDTPGNNYVLKFYGRISESRCDSESYEERSVKTIGKIEGSRVLVSAMRERGADPFWMCDDVSGELATCAGAVFDEDGYYRESIGLCGISEDLLVLEHLSILPAHRGNNAGLLAMLDAIKRFGSECNAVAIEPFPLQLREWANEEDEKMRPDRRMGYASMPKGAAAAKKKLRAHYAKLGFKPVAGSTVMILDMGLKRPSLASVLSPRRRRSRARVS